eukprot:TRINITY_DN8257_c0_g1_i2.p1 TRINITY_DN8257_c0_g1~~TRINITY_DN8257_c0_g1_i2.p1  ORF type:complete len:226 (+),score=100.58 TRINITY_DN8257_c0_g1_i2:89-766(+)
MSYPLLRLRRPRMAACLRDLVQEHRLHCHDLIHKVVGVNADASAVAGDVAAAGVRGVHLRNAGPQYVGQVKERLGDKAAVFVDTENNKDQVMDYVNAGADVLLLHQQPALDALRVQLEEAGLTDTLLASACDFNTGVVSPNADLLFVPGGLTSLDFLHHEAQATMAPVVAQHAEGDVAMLAAAAAKGWLDEPRVVLESLQAFKRAGANMVCSPYALQAAKWLDSM